MDFAVLVAIVVAMALPPSASAQEIFVSIPPQAFVVEQLVGDRIQVNVMLPPGASPATYEPTPKQMAALDRARLYLQIGAPFEGPVLDKVADLMPELRVVDCRGGITLEPVGDGHSHGGGLLDPHIWLDPSRMKVVATTTAEALETLLPDFGAEIERRLASLHRSIDDTDARVAATLSPHAGSTVFVFHPAYGYFTRRYELIQMAVEVDGKAPSARQLATVVEELRDRPTRALFVQPQFSRSAAERVARALDCGLVELDPLARDYLTNLEQMARRIAEAMP